MLASPLTPVPLLLAATIPDMWFRFVDKHYVCPQTGCWVWEGAQSTGQAKGNERKCVYGTFWDSELKRPLRAHVWIAWRSGIILQPRLPAGMQLDHTCCNSICVNPGHLELVTREENYERAKAARSDPDRP